MQRINCARRRRALARSLLLAVTVGISGCIAVPYPSPRVLEGREVTEASLKGLRVNETTRTQVLERFGPPDIDFVDQHVIAYAWAGIQNRVFVATFVGSPGSPVLTLMRRALLVRFDADNKVAAFSIIDRPTQHVAYDALNHSDAARLDDWRVILGHWLAGQTSRGE